MVMGGGGQRKKEREKTDEHGQQCVDCKGQWVEVEESIGEISVK